MRVAPPVRALTALGLAAALAGCGDPALWTRWRAERATWRGARELRRLDLEGGPVSEARAQRAARAIDGVLRIAPFETWSSSSAPGDPRIAREVAVLSGRALVARAELELRRGRTAEGLAGLTRAFERCAGMPEVARGAAWVAGTALERMRRDDEAAEWFLRLGRDFDPYDAATGFAINEVIDGARRGARALERKGDRAGGAALLAGVATRLGRELAGAGFPAPREQAWRALAALRSERGDAEGALDALRHALPGAGSPELRAVLVLDLARTSLSVGWPDSARVYAAWVERFGGDAAREGMRIEAMSWEASALPDSALDAWARLIEAYPKAQDSAAESRFRRGVLLEDLGRWEAARSEFRALAAAQPSHPLAFEAQLRIVRHHADRHEDDLARLEARRLVEIMDILIETQMDDDVQRSARRTRGEALLAAEDWSRAFDQLAQVWRRWPETSTGLDAAWRAVDVAGPHLERARSDSLLASIAGTATDPAQRLRARARLAKR